MLLRMSGHLFLEILNQLIEAATHKQFEELLKAIEHSESTTEESKNENRPNE